MRKECKIVSGITNYIDRRTLTLTDEKKPLLEPIPFHFFEEKFESYDQLLRMITQQPFVPEYAAFISMIHLAPIPILFMDDTQKILYINEAGMHLTHKNREEVIGQTLDNIHPTNLHKTDIQRIWKEGTAINGWNGTIDYQHYSGEKRTQWIQFIHFPAPQGKRPYYGLFFLDKIVVRKTDEVTAHLTYTDPVTGLANFNQFAYDSDQIEKHETIQPCAVALFRCSNIAEIAVLYSKNVRKIVTFEMVHRIQELLPEKYKFYRLSREIFCIFAAPLTDIEEFKHLLENIREQLLQPVPVADQTILMDFEIGVAHFPEETTDFCSLLEDAEICLNEHQQKKIIYYSKEMTQKFVQSLKTVAKLAPAIKNDALEMYYQPLFNHEKQIVGAEALLRWNDPELGFVPPNELIKYAEKHGHTSELAYWIFERVFKDKIYETIPNVSINIDVTQVEQPNFFKTIQHLVKKYQVVPQRIILEITEHQAFQESPIAVKVMEDLEGMGFKIALDDFGVGHSALALLGKLPAHIVKVDATFITEQSTQTTNGIIAEHIVALAKHLNLKTCCEGIESENDATLAREIHSDYMQGYLFSRPLAIHDFRQFIENFTISDE